MILYSDLETYSPVPISAGVWRYAEEAEVLLWAYAIDDGEPAVWAVCEGAPMPLDLKRALNAPDTVLVGHNWLGFDDIILRHAGLPRVPPERVIDTRLQAYAHSLPGGLEAVGKVLGLAAEEEKAAAEGKKLIRLFCTPKPDIEGGRATPYSHPVEWARFVAYAIQDIVATRVIHKRMPRLNYPDNRREVAAVVLDTTVNARGIELDADFARAAVLFSELHKGRLKRSAQEKTGGALKSTTQVQALLKYLEDAYGISTKSLTAKVVNDLLEAEDTPQEVVELLRNRQEISKASTAKFAKMLEAVSSDGKLRGLLQIYGATRTGRWAGRIVQPQNLPRVPKAYKGRQEEIIAAVKAGVLDLTEDQPMAALSAAVRGALVLGPEGAIADLSNIEGRVLAWLAGEQWKVEAFRAYDAGEGPDLYIMAYSRVFGVKPEAVDDEQRQIGKVLELSMGYQGGLGALMTMAKAYGLDLVAMADKAIVSLPAVFIEEAESYIDYRLEQEGDTALYGLPRATVVTLEAIKRAWRARHEAIVKFWEELEAAFVAAIWNEGVTIPVGPFLRIARKGPVLLVRLPSGRHLCYWRPQKDGVLMYEGVNQLTKRWGNIVTYGGKLAENITQAVARDTLLEGMLRAEANGCEIVLTVHDEIVIRRGDLDALIKAMTDPIDWAPGLPLAAEGKRAYRYQK